MKNLCFLAFSLLFACGDNAADGIDPNADAARYEFPSKFVSGASSVAYAGQSARLVWIAEMTKYIEKLSSEVVTSGVNRADGATATDLDTYYRYDGSVHGTVPLTYSLTPPALQTSMSAMSTTAQLRNKLAGLDSDAAVVMYKDWSSGLGGWSGIGSPDALVQAWIAQLDDAMATYNPAPPQDPSGQPIPKVYVTATGLDLSELLQKFLLGAVALSQASDDYLDDANPGTGLLSSNAQDGTNPYSTLEHAWDEGFGYFGASRDYADYTDDEIAGAAGRADYRGYHDTNGDNLIDLGAEYIFGAAGYAARRDRASNQAAHTDFSGTAWNAFVAGRQLIASVTGELTASQLDELKVHRDAALGAWEHTIAASIVHYVNEVLEQMNASTGYSFEEHAEAWSEAKGLALSLQFNPRSPAIAGSGPTVFQQLHTLLRDQPVLMNDTAPNIAQYKADLIAARSLLATTYGFATANLGDADGEGGW